MNEKDEEYVIWTLNVNSYNKVELYSDISSLSIIRTRIYKYLTQFTNFPNVRIAIKFSLSLLLKLRYPFYMVFYDMQGSEVPFHYDTRKQIGTCPIGLIRLRVIEGRCLEIYINDDKVGEIIHDPQKRWTFYYLVYLTAALAYEQICYIFVFVFCYFALFVDESGIRGRTIKEEWTNKREKPYIIKGKL